MNGSHLILVALVAFIGNNLWLLKTSAGNIATPPPLPMIITIIEDQNTNPPGIYITTGEDNYAVFTPNLTAKHWVAYAVSGDDLYILATNNKTLTTKTKAFSEQTRQQISKIESNFKRNLAGLTFTPPPNCSYTENQSSESVSSYSSNFYNTNNNNNNNNGNENVAFVNENYAGNYGPTNGPIMPQQMIYDHQSQYGNNFGVPQSQQNNYESTESVSNQAESSSSTSYKSSPPSSTVYNNLANSKLNETLDGDVYQIAFANDNLDIFSTTISVRRDEKLLSFYRDYRYFAFRKPDMALDMNLMFINGNFCFFVYSNGKIKIKSGKQLDGDELKVVVDARLLLKDTMKQVENAVYLQQSDELNLDSGLPLDGVLDGIEL